MKKAAHTTVGHGAGNTGYVIATSLFKLYVTLLGICLLGRLLLFGWQYGRLQDLAPLTQAMAFVYGMRMDTIMISYLLVPMTLLLTLWPGAVQQWAALLVRSWALLVLLLLTFVEIATFPFFAEYDVRPNITFVEYLKYPHEVMSMLWKDQQLSLAIAAVALTSITTVFFRIGAFLVMNELRAAWWKRALWCVPLLIILFAGIRSTTGHRAANNSDALYSSNRVANEITKNSLYSIGFEAFRARNEGARYAPKYGAMDMAEAYARAYRLLDRTPGDAASPFLQTIQSSHPATTPRNLVILLQESMGAQFVGFAGARHSVTPFLDGFATHSLTFTNLYSNGTRSIRGLAAMSSGFLPLLGEGVIKRPKSQQDFFTLASLLKSLGYHSSFIYGGAARFDDMKTWYLGNGFDEVIEQKDYTNPGFVSTWGVSDEDLMIKANERFTALNAAATPFVSVVFSSSNHTPFELPDGKIAWEPNVPRQSVENAIKYADYALRRFFELAMQSAYYQNTVFVVVADHNVRVYGDDVVPVPGFHIPGLIHLQGMAPLRFVGLVSQPDVLATALDMLGVTLRTPVLGTSIFQAKRPAFVMMQFNETYGFRRNGQVAVLRADKPSVTYTLQKDRLIPAAHDTELEADGLALLHVTEDLYERRLYRAAAP